MQIYFPFGITRTIDNLIGTCALEEDFIIFSLFDKQFLTLEKQGNISRVN